MVNTQKEVVYMKKYLMIASVIALPFTASADGYYAKLGYGLQDGLNGGNNASEYGLTVGKKLNDVFSAEIKTRLKVKDGSTGNDQRVEFALIGLKKFMVNLVCTHEVVLIS